MTQAFSCITIIPFYFNENTVSTKQHNKHSTYQKLSPSQLPKDYLPNAAHSHIKDVKNRSYLLFINIFLFTNSNQTQQSFEANYVLSIPKEYSPT